jgi:cellulose synthase/poly-beta-1,6-N-acetylglucosamine synthase-like glycosyltransferase
MRKDAKVGAVIGKLLKYDFAANGGKGEKTKIIDSAGLVMYKNRRCVDRGQGEEDRGQFEKAEEVFGVTGACPLYRVSALTDCGVNVGLSLSKPACLLRQAQDDKQFQGDKQAHHDNLDTEIFDNDFFMYKEDVDLAWRMRLFGWKSFYLPESVAYHGRGTGAIPREGILQTAKGRKSLSKFQKSLSYRNERLMRVKNEIGALVARDLPQIVWKEFLFFALAVVSENFLFRSFWEFLKLLPRALRKRRQIMRELKKRGVTGRVFEKEMGRWFV